MTPPVTSSGRKARQRLGAYLLAVLAVVTCPCHLPIWIGVLAGAFLGEQWGLAAMRAFSSKG